MRACVCVCAAAERAARWHAALTSASTTLNAGSLCGRCRSSSVHKQRWSTAASTPGAERWQGASGDARALRHLTSAGVVSISSRSRSTAGMSFSLQRPLVTQSHAQLQRRRCAHRREHQATRSAQAVTSAGQPSRRASARCARYMSRARAYAPCLQAQRRAQVRLPVRIGGGHLSSSTASWPLSAATVRGRACTSWQAISASHVSSARRHKPFTLLATVARRCAPHFSTGRGRQRARRAALPACAARAVGRGARRPGVPRAAPRQITGRTATAAAADGLCSPARGPWA